MALVSYDVSDASDLEEEDTEPVPKTLEKDPPKKDLRIVDEENEAGPSEDGSLFSVLPTPKSGLAVFDSDFTKRLLLNKPLKIAEKPAKKSVKITLPALSEFEEDLPRPIAKKVTPSSKGSGLFDILPPPKNTGMAATLRLMPDSLKKGGPTPKPALKPVKPLPKPVLAPVVAPPLTENDDDSDEESSGDFFSLNKPTAVEPTPVELRNNMVPDVLMPQISEVEVPREPTEETSFHSNPDHYETAEFVPVATDDLTLDDEAIQKLCGGGKRKRNALQAQLIDVSEKDVVPDKNEWLMKTLTEEKRTRSHKKSSGPSSQQKRKHQITYLAFQAKEQEQELQNQWANNKMTKKQTQSKYGF